MTENCENTVSGTGVSRKRKAISLAMKLDIIKRSGKQQTPSSIARVYGVNRSTIATIIKDKERILEQVKRLAPMDSTIISKKRPGVISQMEKLLILWIEDQRLKGVPVSLTLIQDKARSLYEDLKKILGENAGSVEPFTASRGWYNRFKARLKVHNAKVSRQAVHGEVAAATNVAAVNHATEKLAATEFAETFSGIVKQGDYNEHQIFNVNKIGLYWKKMLHKAEESTSGFSAAKDYLSLLLGCNTAGDFKLKPLLVYHSENPVALKGITKASLPVVWTANRTSSLTVAIFEDWFYRHFIPEVELYCTKKGIPFKILLVLDRASEYPVHLADFHPAIKVVFLPPSITLLQPMNQGVTSAFNAYYTRCMYTQAIRTLEGGDVTLEEFWTSYSVYSAIKNINASWNEVSETTLNFPWKRLAPQLVHDSTGFDEVLQDVMADIVNIAKQLELDVGLKDVEELLDSHAIGLSDEDLLELDAQKAAEDEHADVDEGSPPKKFDTKKMADAFRMIKSGLALLEEEDPYSSRVAVVSKAISNAIACYKDIYAEKMKTAQSKKKPTQRRPKENVVVFLE